MKHLMILLAICFATTASAQISGLFYFADVPMGGPIELLLREDGTWEERNNTVMGGRLFNGTYIIERDIIYLYMVMNVLGEERSRKRRDHYKLKGANLQRLDLPLLYLKAEEYPKHLKERSWTVKELILQK